MWTLRTNRECEINVRLLRWKKYRTRQEIAFIKR